MFFIFLVFGLALVVMLVNVRDSNRPHHDGNQFSATILADSVSPSGYRLTTMLVTFPRFILAEFNTHRVLSRNSASSRAIPIRKQIKRVIYFPFVPIGFGGAQGGMVAAADLQGWKARTARQMWLKSRWAAIAAAFVLDRLGVHKAFANRLLEPWIWHTVIVTATEWDNLFALRTDEAAQPEFRTIAEMMRNARASSTPKALRVGEWHLPMVKPADGRLDQLPWASAGRCARVSFDNHNRMEAVEKSIDRAAMLSKSGHWSPFEHQARVANSVTGAASGNLSGDWHQFRKMFDNESNYAALKVPK